MSSQRDLTKYPIVKRIWVNQARRKDNWKTHHRVTFIADFDITPADKLSKPVSFAGHEDADLYVHIGEWNKRDEEAKKFCQLYNDALSQIVELKKRLGEDPGDL